jgi:anti-sigma factor RsiW
VDCKDAQKLLDSYADRELDLAHSLEIENHLQQCDACSKHHESRQLLQSALSSASLYFKAPADLSGKIQSSLRRIAKAERAPQVRRWRWLNAAVPMAVAAIVILILVPLLRRPSADEILSRELVSNHVRSLMVNHLADVASSDEHTVKPWFAGKLNFSPLVVDLENQGFPLVGGRLDYVDNKPVAALVYGRHKHFINLFVWPSASVADAEIKAISRQGYNLFHWTKAGMTYWAVSDLNNNELEEFARQIQDQGSLTP